MGKWTEQASGQGADVPTAEATLKPMGYQQITSVSASTALTVPAGARIADIIAQTQAVRWRDDGQAPTASVGMPLATGVTLRYAGDLSAIRFIEQSASAALNVVYYQ